MMLVEYVKFEGVFYPIITLSIFEGTEEEYPETVSTETLGNIIHEAEMAGDYSRVRWIDEKIGFFVPDQIIGNKEAMVKFVEENEF